MKNYKITYKLGDSQEKNFYLDYNGPYEKDLIRDSAVYEIKKFYRNVLHGKIEIKNIEEIKPDFTLIIRKFNCE